MSSHRDVFIAHAFHDKEAYVRPLAVALGRRAVSCWIDDAQIGPGDSLIDAMNLGIGTSRYVAVIITERFLAGPWASRELNAALQLEARQEKTKVLPIVVVPSEKIEEYPLLLDKRWLAWSDGPEAIADEIGKLFSRSAAPDWHVDSTRVVRRSLLGEGRSRVARDGTAAQLNLPMGSLPAPRAGR